MVLFAFLSVNLGVLPESGAFSLAKRGPRGELAAIRGDFGILSLT
jgi:hypothetical protein